MAPDPPSEPEHERSTESHGRIHDVRQGVDGLIYLVTDDREGRPTRILRLVPASRPDVR